MRSNSLPVSILLSAVMVISACSKDDPTAATVAAGSAAIQPHLPDQHDEEFSGSTIPFAFVRTFLEANRTDGDLGLQVHFDGEDWQKVIIVGPDGEEVLEIEAESGLSELGLTELRFESAEPSPGEVFALISEGVYEFKGKTVEGGILAGTAVLSHDMPAAPTFTPSDGELVDLKNVIVEWDPVAGAAGYEVIVSNEDLGVHMELNVLAYVTALRVPPTFLSPGTDYGIEVLSIFPNGNKTISEGSFRTLP